MTLPLLGAAASFCKTNTMPDLITCRQTMLLYLKARIPFISLRTDERDRALELFRGAALELNIPMDDHTLSQGIRDMATNRVVSEDRSVAGALDFASQQILQRQNLTFVLTEVQDIDSDTPLSRQMLDVASSATERGGAIVVITTSSIWGRLQRQGMTLALEPPNEDEMRAIIVECLSPYRGSMPIEWGDPELTEAAAILSGVTRIEAENALATFLAKGSILKSDLPELSQVKDRIFADISGLERVKIAPKDVTIGGLAGMQAWLKSSVLCSRWTCESVVCVLPGGPASRSAGLWQVSVCESYSRKLESSVGIHLTWRTSMDST